MLYLGINTEKRFYLSNGVSFAGEKGVTAELALPSTIDGETLSGFDAGAVYIKYGDAYAEITLSALTGTLTLEIPDEALASEGTIYFWAEFSADSGDVVRKTSLLPYIVGSSETYSAPEGASDGEGGDS